MKDKKIVKILILFFSLVVLLFMVVQLLPLIEEVISTSRSGGDIDSLVDLVGFRGVIALVALASLQVIIPFIPAPMVGILSGLSYGVIFGPIIFLIGISIGNLFVIFLVREFREIVPARSLKEDCARMKLKKQLTTMKHPELMAFLLALIPGLSGVGPYVFAETKISPFKYVLAVVLGTIPFTFVYVYLGDHLSKGNYTPVIIGGIIIIIIMIILLINRKKIMDKIIKQTNEV